MKLLQHYKEPKELIVLNATSTILASSIIPGRPQHNAEMVSIIFVSNGLVK